MRTDNKYRSISICDIVDNTIHTEQYFLFRMENMKTSNTQQISLKS
jgi:hypothetical protein